MASPSPAARAPRRDALANRRSILNAAAVALRDDPHASIDAIARRAQLTRRTLYGHFADRDALIRELVATGAERFNDIAAETHDDDPVAALALLAARLWDEAADVQLAAALALDERHASDTGHALTPVRTTLARIVDEGRERGSIRSDIVAPTLARLLEETARAVIRTLDASTTDARATAVRTLLSVAGLSWRECDSLFETRPDILGGTA